jgi:hypothetical protein
MDRVSKLESDVKRARSVDKKNKALRTKNSNVPILGLMEKNKEHFTAPMSLNTSNSQLDGD